MHLEKTSSFDTFLEEYLEQCDDYNQLGGDKNGLSIEYTYKFKELTSLIDYNCNFYNGVCEKSRKIRKNLERYPESSYVSTNMCCCEGCHANFGYISYVNDFRTLKYLYTLYDIHTGFWRENGCILPRKLRSVTCLMHRCNNHGVSDAVSDLMKILDEGLIEIDNYMVKHGVDIKYVEKYESKFIKIVDHGGKVIRKYTREPKFIRGRYGSHPKCDMVYDHLRSRLQNEIILGGINSGVNFGEIYIAGVNI